MHFGAGFDRYAEGDKAALFGYLDIHWGCSGRVWDSHISLSSAAKKSACFRFATWMSPGASNNKVSMKRRFIFLFIQCHRHFVQGERVLQLFRQKNSYRTEIIDLKGHPTKPSQKEFLAKSNNSTTTNKHLITNSILASVLTVSWFENPQCTAGTNCFCSLT